MPLSVAKLRQAPTKVWLVGFNFYYLQLFAEPNPEKFISKLLLTVKLTIVGSHSKS